MTMTMTILWTIIKAIAYGFMGWSTGRYWGERFMKRRVSNASKRKLKAKYFALCEKVVMAEGTGTFGDASIKEMKKVSIEMCDAGMGEIAKQEYNNLIKLYKDLGYTLNSDKDE